MSLVSVQSDPRIAKRLAQFVACGSALAVSFGLLVLVGWAFHLQRLKTLLPGQVTAKGNTGVCFLLIGLALRLVRKEEPGWKRLAHVLATIVGVVGFLSLLEHWRGWELGIDELLFTHGPEDVAQSARPALMSPITAFGFWFVGTAVVLLAWNKRWTRWFQQILAGMAAVGSLFGLLDFVLVPGAGYTHMAPATAFCMFLFSFAVLFCQTDYGLGALFTSTSTGGEVARRLLPAAVLVPIVIAWLRWKGQTAGLYSDWVGVGITSVSSAVLLAALTAWTAFILDRTDAEKQEAEKSLRLQANLYGTLISTTSDGYWRFDREGKLLDVNEAYCQMSGWSRDDLLRMHIRDIEVIEKPEEVQQHIQRLIETGFDRFESQHRRKGGSVFDVELSASAFPPTGQFLLFARDISPRKRAEEKARTASLYTRSLIEASLDPLVTISREGKITDVNVATEKVTGVARERLIGSDFSTYFTEPDKARRGYEEVFAKGFVRDYALAIRNTSNRISEVLYNASVFRNEHGEVEGVFAAARDITERTRAQEEVRRAFLYSRSLIEASLDPLVTISKRGKIMDVNRATELATGFNRAQLIGTDFSNYFTDPETARRGYERVFAEESVRDYPLAIRHVSGSIMQVLYNATLFRKEAGEVEGVFAAARDVTQIKAAEREIRQLNEGLERRVAQRTAQLEASNKELEAFTYSVSHDLRAPLRHISGFSKILTEEFAPQLPADAQHHLQRISEGTRRMGLLVDDLLNLGRVGRHELRLQVTGLNSVLNEVIAELQPETEGRQIEWKIGTLPYLECDAALMKQVFLNLLLNAVKFTRPRAQAVIEIGRMEQGGVPVVYVRDNGVGFSMKYADKLFGVFQRLHRPEDFEGTGVGLATVQRIIQKHGGRIWAEAELDKGATFYFTLGSSEKADIKAKAVVAGDKS